MLGRFAWFVCQRDGLSVQFRFGRGTAGNLQPFRTTRPSACQDPARRNYAAEGDRVEIMPGTPSKRHAKRPVEQALRRVCDLKWGPGEDGHEIHEARRNCFTSGLGVGLVDDCNMIVANSLFPRDPTLPFHTPPTLALDWATLPPLNRQHWRYPQNKPFKRNDCLSVIHEFATLFFRHARQTSAVHESLHKDIAQHASQVSVPTVLCRPALPSVVCVSGKAKWGHQ